jgi:death-on-curing protein
VDYLTVEQVLFLHARLIEETGGSHGVRDLGLLQSAAARPQATFDAEDLYPSLPAKAAALMESIVRGHPFVDGNKRTGIAAAALFLWRNGCRLTAGNDELESFAVEVADGSHTMETIEGWLLEHCQRRRSEP